METNGGGTVAKRLWHIVRVVYYMLREGLSKRKLMMELHLLLKRGKIAGKAIGNLMFHHHHHQHGGSNQPDHHYSGSNAAGNGGGYYAAFSCRSMDPNLSYYDPREVQFSCSNTPYNPFFLNNRRKRHGRHDYSYDCDIATVNRALEIINAQLQVPESPDVMATPSPAPYWNFGISPMVGGGGRQLRITDSPFPIEEEGEVDRQVDSKADEFIKRFYEQLRMQKTPSIEQRYRSRAAVYG